MLAAALSYKGRDEESDFGSIFVRQFNDFKVVKLTPCDEAEKGRLQLCQPEEYKELVKHIQKKWDPSETFLEISGLKVKLLRAVRQMFFFDEERKYEKVLLEGGDSIKDFPWALQIVVIQPPVPEAELNPELISRADILVINDSPEEESRDFIAGLKLHHPDIPVFKEKIREDFSNELKDSLEALFAVYLEKRERIRAVLEEKLSEPSISCEQARRMARELRVSSFLFGNVCDECGYSITHCGLSCF